MIDDIIDMDLDEETTFDMIRVFAKVQILKRDHAIRTFGKFIRWQAKDLLSICRSAGSIRHNRPRASYRPVTLAGQYYQARKEFFNEL